MCGIFALLNNSTHKNKLIRDAEFINNQFEKGRGRGPEHSSLTLSGVQSTFGFHRLAINGLNPESNQPLVHNNMKLICNGEIYNYSELYEMMGLVPRTDSDCEVILHLYERYGMEHTLQLLDGVFAFILLDNRSSLVSGSKCTKLYVARDPYGVRPLYMLSDEVETEQPFYGFASETKMLAEIYSEINNAYDDTVSLVADRNVALEQFPPGNYAVFALPNKVLAQWTHIHTTPYHSTGFNSNVLLSMTAIDELPNVFTSIQHYFMAAVFKRCCTTERPIASLLSGGLDSSLVTALVAEYHAVNNLPPLETFSIGLAGSEDLKNARIVADYLGTNHTEIIVTEADFINAVPDVIRAIESYDTTTVRASIGNWLLGKYISENSEAKVVFNGDGSDELCGGYLYMGQAPDALEFDRECRRLLRDIHAFDVLRSDRCISSHGLEPRTPFLDRSWVQYYLSILPQLRFHPHLDCCEKYLLRNAFSHEHFHNTADKPILPYDVLWRRKEAFSDGVTGQSRSLYQILGEHAEQLNLTLLPRSIIGSGDVDSPDYSKTFPKTAEQLWYRHIFESNYSGLGSLVPYFWMPRYVDASDASARTLSIYADRAHIDEPTDSVFQTNI